jgi:hypothetical protein
MHKSNGSVSQVEYAKRRGVSQPYISQLVKRGVLPVLPGGKLDPDACDIAMATIRPRVRGWGGAKSDPTRTSYLEARAVNEHYKAKTQKLVYEQMRGDVVDANLVLEQATAAFSNCRTRLLALPRSLAPVLAAQSSVATVERILADGITGALITLSIDIFAPDAPKEKGDPNAPSVVQ